MSISVSTSKTVRKAKETFYKAKDPYNTVYRGRYPVFMNEKGDIIGMDREILEFAELLELRKEKAAHDDEMAKIKAENIRLKNAAATAKTKIKPMVNEQEPAAGNTTPHVHDEHCSCGCHEHNHEHKPEFDVTNMINNASVNSEIAADANKTAEQLQHEIEMAAISNGSSCHFMYPHNLVNSCNVYWCGETDANGNPAVDMYGSALVKDSDGVLYTWNWMVGRPDETSEYAPCGYWTATPWNLLAQYGMIPAPQQQAPAAPAVEPVQTQPANSEPVSDTISLESLNQSRDAVLAEHREKVAIKDAAKYPAPYTDPNSDTRKVNFNFDPEAYNEIANQKDNREFYHNQCKSDEEYRIRKEREEAEQRARLNANYREANNIRTASNFADAVSHAGGGTESYEAASAKYNEDLRNFAENSANNGMNPAAQNKPYIPEFVTGLDPAAMYIVSYVDPATVEELNFAKQSSSGYFDVDEFTKKRTLYTDGYLYGDEVNPFIAYRLGGCGCFKAIKVDTPNGYCNHVA